MPNVQKLLMQNHEVMRSVEEIIPALDIACKVIVAALKANKKLLLCGNGGSAAYSQHIAAEIVGRFERERRGLAAIALTTDASILTSVADDYAFNTVFARQVQALGQPGDVLIASSSNGSCGNVIEAVEEAKQIGFKVIAVTGELGSSLGRAADVDLTVASEVPARVLEAQIFIGHALCAAIDEAL